MHLSLFLYVELISYIALDRLLDRLTCSSVFVLVLFFLYFSYPYIYVRQTKLASSLVNF